MAYSLGLTLYNLAAQNMPQVAPSWPDRPRGRLVWLHAPGVEAQASMLELARHLIDDDGVAVVLTGADPQMSAALHQSAPLDQPRAVQAFLDHWQPEVIVFGDGEIRPAMIHECAHRKLPLIMVDGRAPRLMRGRDGWYPGLMRQALAPFRQIMALDDGAAKAWRRAGAEPGQIAVTGRMEEASAALPYVESDRAALAHVLATRPIWLAAGIAPEEEAAVIAAHRDVLRLAHRLLLILVPQNPDRAESLAARIEAEEGWRVALRKSDDEPDTETEVYIPDSSDYGLWYRLAPVTFLGGSLDGKGCARNPMEPAALGSAILYGPRSGAYGLAYGRLGAARAARMVGSGSDLTLALGDLLSPDRAARQAQAAWAIASEGAEVTERVLNLIRDILDGVA
ncbi:MAG: glycosyltransferase N-terminal domain-containing protein [Paracoccaceae bacterium]